MPIKITCDRCSKEMTSKEYEIIQYDFSFQKSDIIFCEKCILGWKKIKDKIRLERANQIDKEWKIYYEKI